VAATTTLVAVALVAIEFVAAIAVAALAFKALAGRTLLTRFCRRCALNSRHWRWRSRGIGRCTLAGLSEFVVAAATAMALLARRALSAFAAGRCCCRAFGRAAAMARAVAILMRST